MNWKVHVWVQTLGVVGDHRVHELNWSAPSVWSDHTGQSVLERLVPSIILVLHFRLLSALVQILGICKMWIINRFLKYLFSKSALTHSHFILIYHSTITPTALNFWSEYLIVNYPSSLLVHACNAQVLKHSLEIRLQKATCWKVYIINPVEWKVPSLL